MDRKSLRASSRTLPVVTTLLAVFMATGASALYMVIPLGKDPVSDVAASSYGWPKGALNLVNHRLRTEGWNRIFSGCPNDVQQFGYRLTGNADAGELIRAAAQIEGPKTTVSIDPAREYRPDRDAKVGYEATFMLGSQKLLDQWWKGLPGGKFGVNVYKEPPRAMAPNLTLYAGGDKVDLQSLRLPPGTPVAAPTEEMMKKQKIAPDVIEKIRLFVAANTERKP